MRIYIESTNPSYVVARPAGDLLQAARQQLTRDWWEFRRTGHELFTSQLVLDEIAFGEAEMAGRRLELMSGITLLESTEQAGELTATSCARGCCRPKPRETGRTLRWRPCIKWIFC